MKQSGKKIGFWKRQFQVESTKKQKVFDWIFGIILPTICFYFDPIVFRTDGYGSPLFGQYKPFAYILSFVSIMSLTAFMLWGARLKSLNGFLSGLFATGAVVSLIVGIVIFPFSVMGLVILLGVLGFTPLFTAFVYWRNAVRTYKIAQPLIGINHSVKAMILSALFGLITPSLINIEILKSLKTLQNGSATEIRQTANRLKYIAFIADFKNLYLKSENGHTADTEENRALEESYKMLTGKELIRW